MSGAVQRLGSLRAVESRLEQQEARLERILAASYELRRRFAATFTDPPVTLVFRPGTKGRLAWRGRGASGAFIRLDSEHGHRLLQALPESARRILLDFDAERDDLAVQFRIVSTETMELRQWIERRWTRQRLRKSMCS